MTLLWALKNDGLGKPGYGDLIPVLAAGRTSVVTDASFERMFYKLAGFRFLGKRAVRIDILERLADLIRPLLQWKPGQQPRPEGAYDGRRFTTTTAMAFPFSAQRSMTWKKSSRASVTVPIR